jgi:hypothetical protein
MKIISATESPGFIKFDPLKTTNPNYFNPDIQIKIIQPKV